MESSQSKSKDLNLCGIVRSPYEILNIFKYAMPVEDIVEKFSLLNKHAMKCVNIFDKAIQKMLKPEINTIEFNFEKEMENVHAGQVTKMVIYDKYLIS